MSTATDQHPAGMTAAEQDVEWKITVAGGPHSEHELTFESMEAAVKAQGDELAGLPALLSKTVTTYYLTTDQLPQYREFIENEGQSL